MSINVLTSTIAIASLSYVQPVFQANYVEIQVTAQVTMPDVLNVDIVTPTDLVTLATQKSLQDNATPIDAAVRATAKKAADVLTTPSDNLKRNFSKSLADIQTIADAKGISLGKALADTTTPQDLATRRTVKALADTLEQPIDGVANVIYKALADSVTLEDVAAAFKLYIRAFDDSVTAPDLYADFFESGVTSEVTSAFDNSRKEATKGLSDGINAIDNMDGDLTYAFVKVVSELLLGSDAQIIDFTAQKADNIATDSSGILSMQDYCDITYFLEDYVGISRTFT